MSSELLLTEIFLMVITASVLSFRIGQLYSIRLKKNELPKEETVKSYFGNSYRETLVKISEENTFSTKDFDYQPDDYTDEEAVYYDDFENLKYTRTDVTPRMTVVEVALIKAA